MKNLLTIVLLLLASLTAEAQGRWEVVHNEADPMKGEVERDVYIYSADNIGSVVVWDWSKADFRLITNKGLFNIWVSSGSAFAPVKVDSITTVVSWRKCLALLLCQKIIL